MAQNVTSPCSLFRGQVMGSGAAKTQNNSKISWETWLGGGQETEFTQKPSLQVAKNESEEGCCACESKEGAVETVMGLCFVVNLVLKNTHF